MAATAAEGVAPVAHPDAMRGTVGQPTIISPLANDVPGSDPLTPSARLRLAGQVASPADVTVTTDLDTGRVTAVATKPGTYFLDYTAAFGSAKFAQGRIRLDISAANPAGDAPVALPDQAVVRGRTPVLIDLLGNDFDPAGKVLTVQAATALDPDQMQVAVLGGRWLRVMPAIDVLVPNPAIVHYQVTNGSATVQGDVTVTQLPALAPDPALVRDDFAVVRDDDSVLVHVLANDASQAGAPLTLWTTTEGMPAGQLKVLDPAKAAGADQGDVGRAYVSGSSVRYVAPTKVDTQRQVLIEYTAVTEAGEPKSGLVHVTINPQPTEQAPDQPPTPADLDARVVAGDRITIPVPTTGIDADGDTAVVVGVTTAPKLGRVVGTSPTGVTYEAYPNHGVAGTDSFEYVMVDRYGKTGKGTVRIGVVAPGQTQPPVAINDVLTAKPGAVVKVNPMGNDLTAPGDRVTVVPLEQINRPVPTGVTLQGDEGPVSVTAPTQDGAPIQVGYALKGNGGVGPSATIVVSARSGYENPPRIYDAAAVVKGQSATADVLKQAWDPDGDTSRLKVTKVGGGATVDGGVVTAQVTDRVQAIAYEVTDEAGSVSAAVVYVPRSGNGAPFVKADGVIKVDQNKSVTVNLSDYVESTRGKQVRATLLDLMSGSPEGSVTLTGDGDTKLAVSAKNDYTGPGAVSLEVTDGDNLADPNGLKAFVTIPVQVGPPTPVLYCPASAQSVMQGGQPLRLDIATLCHVWAPPGTDVSALNFTADWSKPIAQVTAEGGREVTVKAAGAAVPGQTGELTIGVAGVAEVKEQPLVIGVLKAPPPTLVLRAINEVKQGTSVKQTVSMQSPLLDAVPTVVSIRQTGGMPSTTSFQGAEITLTPGAASFGTITYEVVASDLADTTRTDRHVRGTLTMVVYGAPGKPPAPQPGQALQSHGATVTILPAAANGAPIEAYEVIWEYGRLNCGLVTSCQIPGLTNGKPVTFRVRAQNKAGWGPESDPSIAVVPDQRPGAVIGFTASNPRDKLINLAWSALQVDGTPVTTYTITNSCGSTQTVNAPTTTIDVTTNSNNTVCNFSIIGTNKAGPSTSAASTTGQSSGRPIWGAAPRLTKRAGADPAFTPLDITWTSVDPQGPTPVTYVVKRTPGATVCTTTTTSCLDPRIVYDGTVYTYAVTATNATGGATHATDSAPAQFTATSSVDPWTAIQLTPTGNDSEARLVATAPATRGRTATLTLTGASWGQGAPTISNTASTPINTTIRFTSNGGPKSITLTAASEVDSKATSGSVTPFGSLDTPMLNVSQNGTSVTISASADGKGMPATLTVSGCGLPAGITASSSAGIQIPNQTHKLAYSQNCTITAALVTGATNPARSNPAPATKPITTPPAPPLSPASVSAGVNYTTVTVNASANGNGESATLTVTGCGQTWTTSSTGAMNITQSFNAGYSKTCTFTASLASGPTTPQRANPPAVTSNSVTTSPQPTISVQWGSTVYTSYCLNTGSYPCKQVVTTLRNLRPNTAYTLFYSTDCANNGAACILDGNMDPYTSETTAATDANGNLVWYGRSFGFKGANVWTSVSEAGVKYSSNRITC